MTFRNRPAMSQRWFFDVQWSNCPEDVEQIVEDLWRYHELGNDNYILKRSIQDLKYLEEEGFEAEVWKWGETPEEKIGWVTEPKSIQPLIDYLSGFDIPEDEDIIIHWWW